MSQRDDKIKRLFNTVKRGDTSALLDLQGKGKNGSQTVHRNNDKRTKEISLSEVNGSQTVHRHHFKQLEGSENGSQTVHKSKENEKTVHKRFTQPNTNGSQTVHKSTDIFALPATQKDVLFALFKNAQNNGNYTTKKLTLDIISKASGVKKTSLKNTLWRLKNKGLISTVEYKDGRGGWVIYEVSKEAYLELTIFENGSQTVHKRFTQPNTNGPLYSNSSNNITITTEEDSDDSIFQDEWGVIDTTPLKEIGFTKKHLLQLKKFSTPDIVQESINHFSFGLRNNPEFKNYNNPLRVFIGVLRKGEAWIESNYRSPQEIALEKMLLEKKAEKERITKLEEEIFNLDFEEWLNNLSAKEKESFVPGHLTKLKVGSNGREMAIRGILKEHFKNQVWKKS